MAKYLVIVESPAKARTISSILGKNYEVISSMGHIVDLPANKLSVDTENGFKPVYSILPGKEKIIAELKKKAKGKKIIYLATDQDREGESISWHIKEELSGKGLEFRRVVFHEITEEALKKAFKKTGSLDMDKVNAQIARRVLDRVVGYKLSPILWKKIVRGLSAGRVQSVALRFVVEREKDILKFKPKTTFSIEAKLKTESSSFIAKLVKYKGKKAIFDNKEEALRCSEEIKSEIFAVKKIDKKKTKSKPPSPHITSLLQQDAFNRLRFSARKTMLLAQKLYEGVQIKNKSIGLITYMRTDSFRVSSKAKKEVKKLIVSDFGNAFLSQREYSYKKKKGAQEAHEAIRPTSVYRKPQEVYDVVPEEEARLYEMIWKRFVAAFMKEALYENTKASIISKDALLEVSGRRILFEGYLKVLGYERDQNLLPQLQIGQEASLEGLEIIEHTTKPPPRYNDASLVKLLEEKGIGRPSTYAPTIYTLILRNYAKREKRVFIPTGLGIKVSDLLVEFFPQIMDENFTAHIEEKLDEVEHGLVEWNEILENFYPDFNKRVEKTLKVVKKEIEFSDKICPNCKGRMVFKWSRRGRFLSCEKFPKCRYAESITTGVSCPGCKEGQLIERRNKRGQNFYGCSRFPKCTYTSRILPEGNNSEGPENDKNSLSDSAK
ncbi:MAG: type I DNA topoisomerase [Omnitrophica bacterium]|nr:type I DNA topoisomerase [Candidatus Omnitrophota bacterium]